MTEVLCFLQLQRSLDSSTLLKPSTGWGWITDVVSNALKESAPHFGDFVGMDNPQSSILAESAGHRIRYNALLNLPHVWTEGIELESWDDAEYTVWDLPGQMELYPSHRMFSASATAVYVLVVNGGCGYDACTSKLTRWLSSLRSGFQYLGDGIKVPVRIVLSHTDTLTGLERASLMREVLEVAGQRFSSDFDFGPTCFVTLYGDVGGGDPSTGVDALRMELLRLRSVGVYRHPLPTSYQQACDDVVAMARADTMSRWPIIDVDSLPCYGEPLDAVLGCLEDLGFVRRVGEQLILEPVTWLSRLMAAFLHPFHGVVTVIAKSNNIKTMREHVAAATITSVAASRIVNQRGRIVQLENEGEVLEMLSHFDVCFELGRDQFVFPMLLPLVTTKVPWLEKGFQSRLGESMCAARRYICCDIGDTIPPTVAALLMEAVVRFEGCQPVFLGRCTMIGYLSNHDCYVGLHQSHDDSTIDLFAAGEDQHRFLGLIVLNFAVFLNGHYPRLRVQQQLLWRVGTRKDRIPRLKTEEIDHILLGPCLSETLHDLEVRDVQLEVAARKVPAWLWKSLEAVVIRSGGTSNAAAGQDDTDESIALSPWKRSAIRQTLLHLCQPFCAWVDAHYSGSTANKLNAVDIASMPLRGRRVLVDVLGVQALTESHTSQNETRNRVLQRHTSDTGSIPPHMCGITFEVLKTVYDQAAALAGADFAKWTMRDINRAIVKPLCAQHGTHLR
eukprot:m.293994 g.293994  ORF g.293994 m.293994 type:complete len:729 (+) comp16248_c3_seq1:2490-4676(+)